MEDPKLNKEVNKIINQLAGAKIKELPDVRIYIRK